ncbi:GGDEF domain-containing protein [Ancylobacter terrae]|uniref:GGDEF domain-containing protein n=1 Tax=Ancylobacter sp. sgz301288 TaxID=3342077 RepID=UPI00385815D2
MNQDTSLLMQLEERQDDAEMFDLAPVSLWVEDFSSVKTQLDLWRAAGVTSLRDFLREDVERVRACAQRIRILKVNRRTLSLFGADDLDHLVANLDRVFGPDMLKTHIEELSQLWDGYREFASLAVNYTLSGQRLDIQLKGTILPGYEDSWAKILISIENVTERETARRQAAGAEAYARGLFEHSPVSLWVEDFSSIKLLMDDVRMRGITDFRVFTDVHPEFVERCMSEIRVLDVNRHTLEMFGAPDRHALLRRLGDVFRDDMQRHFREQLVDLWNGKLFQQREVLNYALNGDELHVHLQLSVLPGHEHDWSLVQVALTDITARKKAEAYLEFLGKHDVLTKLHNRSYYADELNRLERRGPFPVTVIVADLNSLKSINDHLGHAAGDALLRRAGEVLGKVVDKPNCAARIGGDEFALLLPGTEEAAGLAMIEQIEKLVELNNQFYSATQLSLAIGVATSRPGERLEAVVKRADLRMYAAKRAFGEGSPPAAPAAG